MIKRPLCLMLAAYVAGIYMAWQQSIYIVIFISVILYLSIYLLLFKARCKIINRQDRFLWVIPILLFTGCLAMKDRLIKPELNDAFEQQITCELNGVITKIDEKQYGYSLYVKDNIIIPEDGKRYLCGNVIIKYMYNRYSTNSSETSALPYKIGNKVHVIGVLKKFSVARNPGGFNEQLFYQIEDIDFFLEAKQINVTDTNYSVYHAFLGAVKNELTKVYDKLLSDKEAGTLIAMLLGEKGLLDDEVKKLYQENGISHILAISGLHIALIGMFFFNLLRKLKCPVQISSLLTILFIYSYGVLTDYSVSTNRAIVMMVISLIAPLTGKTYDMLSATCLSALIILLQNPMQIMSAGFLLSYGAVFGIAVIYPALKLLNKDTYQLEANQSEIINQVNENNRLNGHTQSNEANQLKDNKINKNSHHIVNTILISISTQLSTIPVVLYFFYQFPIYGILINLLILPLITILTLLAILGAIAGIIYLPIGIFIIGGASYILKLYEWICRFGSGLPGNLLTVGKPDNLRILVYFVLLSVFLILVHKYRKKCSIFIIAAGLIFLLFPYSKGELEVTFLDVGQGDAIYIESYKATTYLIDGGSIDVSKVGTYRITPFLLSKGKDVLDYAIITHSDKDHISGLSELILSGDIKIKNLILPDIAAKDEGYIKLEVMARQKNITVGYIKAGDCIKDGDMQITCLHPAKGYLPADSNSYSTVLSVTYGDFDMLLTGDVQTDGEKMIISQLNNKQYKDALNQTLPIDYDLLKVSHHGARSSTSEEFLALISSSISVISCGRDNRYGHPHPQLLERLKEIDSAIRITYDTGALTIITDGTRMKVSEYAW